MLARQILENRVGVFDFAPVGSYAHDPARKAANDHVYGLPAPGSRTTASGISSYEKNRDVGRGGNQPAPNGGKVRALPVPLPPLDEQSAIVAAANKALALITLAEGRIASALMRADKLPQAILSKAFSGELVPTEAEFARLEGRDYEPASVLLERVKAEAATEPTTKKKRATKRQQGVSA